MGGREGERKEEREGEKEEEREGEGKEEREGEREEEKRMSKKATVSSCWYAQPQSSVTVHC